MFGGKWLKILTSKLKTRGPLVLYCSPECWGYVKISGYWEKQVKKYWLWLNWTKVNERPWPLVLIKPHVLILVDCIYQLLYHRLQQFLKNPLFLLNRSIQDQIWSCRKIGQDHPSHHVNKLSFTRVREAAYQVSRSSAFRFQRRRFLKGFTIFGHGGHLGHVT